MSLWKRGKWFWADFTVEGQRFRVPLETTKEREQERIREAREGKLAPRVPDLARMKLADAVETYLRGLRGRIEESSIRSERERLNQVKSFMGDIPVRRISVGLVNEYVTRRVEEGRSGPEWFLFPHCEGLRDFDPTMPMKGWRTAWRKLTRAAELSGFRFHNLRHHAITELAEGSASEQTIKSIAGHISKRMLDHYSHIRREAKRRAVEALESGCHVRPEGVGKRVTSQNHVTNQGNTKSASQ